MNDLQEASLGYLSGVRKARERRAVLKLRFITFKSRGLQYPIFAFEGDDDKIVYGRWIKRLKPNLKYEAFVCKGKKGVKALQAMLLSDLSNLNEGTYLFVDRDFDDYDRMVDNEWTFMTECYSVENYLVDQEVLESVLRDELVCHEEPHTREAILEVFGLCYDKFLDITAEFNRKLFIARRGRLRIQGSLPDKAAAFAIISLNDVQEPAVPAADTITFENSLDESVETALSREFEVLERRKRYRGKNAYLFFVLWLDLLCEELSKKRDSAFGGPEWAGRIRREELGLGAFASKSAVPRGLPEFLDRAAA